MLVFLQPRDTAWRSRIQVDVIRVLKVVQAEAVAIKRRVGKTEMMDPSTFLYVIPNSPSLATRTMGHRSDMCDSIWQYADGC